MLPTVPTERKVISSQSVNLKRRNQIIEGWIGTIEGLSKAVVTFTEKLVSEDWKDINDLSKRVYQEAARPWLEKQYVIVFGEISPPLMEYHEQQFLDHINCPRKIPGFIERYCRETFLTALIKQWTGSVRKELHDQIENYIWNNLRDVKSRDRLFPNRSINHSRLFEEIYKNVAKPWFENRRYILIKEIDSQISDDEARHKAAQHFRNIIDERNFLQSINSSFNGEDEMPKLVNRYLTDHSLDMIEQEAVIRVNEVYPRGKDLFEFSYSNVTRNLRSRMPKGHPEDLRGPSSAVTKVSFFGELSEIRRHFDDKFAAYVRNGGINPEDQKDWWLYVQKKLSSTWYQLISEALKKELSSARNSGNPLAVVFEGQPDQTALGFPFELMLLHSSFELKPRYKHIAIQKRVRFEKDKSQDDEEENAMQDDSLAPLLIPAKLKEQPLRVHIIVSPYSDEKEQADPFYQEAELVRAQVKDSYANNRSRGTYPATRSADRCFIFHPNSPEAKKRELGQQEPRDQKPADQLNEIIFNYRGYPTVNAIKRYFEKLREIKEQEREQALDLVHFIGHGEFKNTHAETGGYIALPRNEGDYNKSLVHTNEFCEMLSGDPNSKPGDIISFVFLSVCSGAAAEGWDGKPERTRRMGLLERLILVGRIPGGLGYRWPVLSDKARKFARLFYEYLLEYHFPAPLAVSYARYKIYSALSCDDEDHTWASIVFVYQNLNPEE